jgi:hypothetical protein
MLLACPINKVGQVTVFQTGRHGAGDGANAPGFIGAIKPQVVVVNNGPRKGFGAADDRVKPISIPGKTFAPYERVTFLRYAKLPSTEGIWQGHLSLLDKDPSHNTAPDQIANFEETANCQGHGITASVAAVEPQILMKLYRLDKAKVVKVKLVCAGEKRSSVTGLGLSSHLSTRELSIPPGSRFCPGSARWPPPDGV